MSTASGRHPLGTTGWWIWSHFALRSTGFPLRDLTEALARDPDDDSDNEETASLRRLLALAVHDRFTTALLWQNPSIVDNVVTPLSRRLHDLDAGTAVDSKKDRRRQHQRERTLASYAQRYYTRNETIGFFGPITWGRFTDQPSAIVVDAGRSLTDQQKVWFEDWSIHRLGTELAADPAIRWHLPPVPALGVQRLGRTVLLFGAAPQRLTEPERAVLDLVDGRRSAAAIAQALGDDRGVASILDSLLDRGIISWGFGIPLDLGAEEHLVEQLRDMPDLPAVRDARAVVARLCAARDRVAAATSAKELAAALDEAEICFTACTHDAPRRTADTADRGRGLFVAQSHRAVDVALSPALLAELAGPLDLVLASARWFCTRIGGLATDRLCAAHHALSAKYGPAGVPANVLFNEALADFVLDPSNAAPVRDELVRRWAAVLRLDADARAVRFTTAELAGAVADSFASASPAWYAGRHHSPDLMIAARDVEAIERGDYQFVLGELHAGTVTCDASSANGFPPAPDAILRPAEAALIDGPQRYVPLYRRGMAGLTARFYPTPETFSPHYSYLSFGPGPGERRAPAGRRVEMSAITVVPGASGLEAEFPDRTRRPILVVFGEFLALLTMQTFTLMPAWPHTPRVTVDRLVVARETWRVPATEFTLPPTRNGRDHVERIRDVAKRYGLPRHCFWRASPRRKPIYLDLHSPSLIRLLAGAVRSADVSSSICFTEMLPGPDQLWLADGHGCRYTSELRLTIAETTDRETDAR